MALFKKKGGATPATPQETQVVPGATTGAPIGAPTSPMEGLSFETPATAPIVPGAPVSTVSTTMVPPDLTDAEARLQQSGMVNEAPRRKKPSGALLGGGALALSALALGGWYFLGAKQEPEEDAVAFVPSRRTASNGAPAAASGEDAGAPNGGARTSDQGRTSGTTSRATPRPGAPKANKSRPSSALPGVRPRGVPVERAKKVAVTQPGRLALRSPSLPAGAPVFAPAKQGQAPSLVPVKGAPTPVSVRDGLEGTPGRQGGRNEVVIAQGFESPGGGSGVTPVTGPLTPALRARLKTLWNQGAAAKQRGDNNAARRTWTQILQIRPGHPRIQEAIDKLQ